MASLAEKTPFRRDGGRFFANVLAKPRSIRYHTHVFYGEVPEWLNGADCKSAGSAFDGSNPSLSTIFDAWRASYSGNT